MLRFVLFFTFLISVLSCGTHKSIPTLPKNTIDTSKVYLDTCPVEEVEEIRVDVIKKEKLNKEKKQISDPPKDDMSTSSSNKENRPGKTKPSKKSSNSDKNGQLVYNLPSLRVDHI